VKRQLAFARWLLNGLLLVGAVAPAYAQAPEVKLPLRDGSVRFAVMMGDNIYSGHKPQDFVEKFEAPYKSVLGAGVKFYACLGNHDDPDIERNYAPYNMGGERYYTFTKGDVEFFALDSNYMDPKQRAWLEGKLKASKAKWKIAYFHHPLFTAAKYHGPSIDLRAQLMPVFTKYGVNVVLYGHEHVYERLKPQEGIYFFLEGSSGQLRYHNLSSKSAELDDVGFDGDQTFMLMEVAGDQLFFQTMQRDGKIIDAGVLNRQGAGKK